jgi:choline dehydrogenase-like flavoprotein
MIVWPSRIGLNAWAKLGNPGWGWDDLAPYVRKFHTASAPSDKVRQFFNGMQFDEKDQGTDGPVQVSFGEEYMPFHGAWFDTLKNLGYPQKGDPINGQGTGPFVTPGAIDPVTHTRSHAGAVYLTDAVKQRPNLRVMTGALVERIVFKKEGDGPAVAIAVHVQQGEKTYEIRINKEVILAAGATQTPQILELSGIGDAKLLNKHGIDMIVDNANVGENLQDHGIVSFGYEVADGMPSGDMARDPQVAAAAMAAYQKDGSGPLGMVGLVSAFLPCLDFPAEERQKLVESIDTENVSPALKKQYEVLKEIIKDPEEPTAQYILAPFQLLPREGPSGKGIFGMSHPGLFISLVALLSYPLARGSVHIKSVNPRDDPVIDEGILRHKVDLELHARHSIFMEKLAETEPLASMLKRGGERLHTPERLTDLKKAEEACKELVLSMYHVSGSCAMLPREDGGVVDTKLRVYGTSNVRVVDASIFPLEPRGNIQATVFAVAEKAADIVKEYH